ncbi:hypothetical protein [Bacillus cereus]|uniref:hypothetical protein n=1 Tax=Bacillus cereus TaxID=1396 RepID=UPI000B4B24DB|nr:hypothetical protein [Bacillus cereus]
MFTHFFQRLKQETGEDFSYDPDIKKIINAKQNIIYEFLPRYNMIKFCGAWMQPNEQWRYTYLGLKCIQNTVLDFHPELVMLFFGITPYTYKDAEVLSKELSKEKMYEYAEQLNEFLQTIRDSFTHIKDSGRNWLYIFEEDFQIQVKWELRGKSWRIRVASIVASLDEKRTFYNGEVTTNALLFIKEYIAKLTLIFTFSTYKRVQLKYPKLHRVMLMRFGIPEKVMEPFLNEMSKNISMSLIDLESALFSNEIELYKQIEITFEPIAAEEFFSYSFETGNGRNEVIYYRRKTRVQLV